MHTYMYTYIQIVSEQGVDLPTAPLTLSVTVSGARQLLVTWDLPANTGVGGQARPLLRQSIQVCMYVCVYVCMCILVCMCVCVCVYIYIYTHTHTYICTRGACRHGK